MFSKDRIAMPQAGLGFETPVSALVPRPPDRIWPLSLALPAILAASLALWTGVIELAVVLVHALG